MLLHRSFRLEKACASNGFRPVLEHVGVKRHDFADEARAVLTARYGEWFGKEANGIATAADGFMLVVVPVVIAPEDDVDDAPVPIIGFHRKALIDARRRRENKSDYLRFFLQGDVVRFDQWTTVQRVTCDKHHTFPDINPIINNALVARSPAASGDGRYRVAISPRLIADIAAAMGNPQHCVFSQGVPLGPIVVRTSAHAPTEGAVLVPPFGVLMPLALAEAAAHAVEDNASVRF